MKRKGTVLFLIALSMASALIGFAQRPTDEQSTPRPRSLQYCLARMANENETVELTNVSQQEAVTKSHYDVSLPEIVNGKKEGYRTERREATQKAIRFTYSHCELETRTLAAYQPNGKRLSVQEIAEQLKPSEFAGYKPVVLSDVPPDDLMATVLASDCIVIVVPGGSLKFKNP